MADKRIDKRRAKWMERRELQGYCYDEIVAEIDRRVAGEYTLSPELAAAKRKEALLQVGIIFRLSALLHDFMTKEGLTLDEFFWVYHDDDPEHQKFLERFLDPFSIGNDMAITHDTEVDQYYPGKSIERNE